MLSEVDLPPPRETGSLSLEEALWRRRSVREFAGPRLHREAIGQLLWAGQGLTDPPDGRPAPSAGGLYPLELYAVTADGVFSYVPGRHSLVLVRTGDRRHALCSAALDQEAIREAPLTIAIAAVYARTARKYGLERGVRYAQIEVGHAAQNILLQAVAEGLGAVTIGAFSDSGVKEALGLPEEQTPLYLMAVGRPR